MTEHDLAEWLQLTRKLYTTPHAVEVLLAVSNGKRPSQAAPPATDPQAVTDALRLLESLGLVRTAKPDAPGPHTQTSATVDGERLAAVLTYCDDVDRMLITTPYAVEILFGLRDGVPPCLAVPPDTDPRAIADAVDLLERLDLIHT